MDLNLETIKTLMSMMNENKISSLRLGELVLVKSQFINAKPTSHEILDEHTREENSLEENEAAERLMVEEWSRTGRLPKIVRNK